MAPQSHGNCPVNIEEAIAFLRQNGCSMIDAIKHLRSEHHLSLAGAKRRVHLSKTWADMRTANDKFHEEVDVAARAITDESAPDS